MSSEHDFPLFPLPIVLFPGMQQPLHIFEPRYRQLVADCLDGNKRFGLSLTRPGRDNPDVPRPGEIGCSTFIQACDVLPDGRSNIIVVGEDRYVVKRLLPTNRLYLMARVEFFADRPEDDATLPDLATQIRRLFTTYARSGEAGEESPLPSALIADPEALSFYVASSLDLGIETHERLFRLTSTKMRLEQLRDLLKPLIVAGAKRATVQRLAKRNGRSGSVPAGGA